MNTYGRDAMQSALETASVSASETANCDYEWTTVQNQELPFMNSLRALFDPGLELFLPTKTARVTRMTLDGTWFLRGSVQGQPLAMVWNDFRVNGASTGKLVAQTYTAFLEALMDDPRPLLIGVRTMGVRFMEGRTVFPHAFNILPTLNRYRKQHLVITLAHGNALGLGTLIYGMGHYRIAVKEESCLNLTGPEVCKMVFGKQVTFEQIAANELQFQNTSLIHEMVNTIGDAFTRIPELLCCFTSLPRAIPTPFKATCTSGSLMAEICHGYREVFPNYDNRIKAYIGVVNGARVGLLINPPENANNMIRARTMQLVEDALSLFEQLQLPVVSLVDTPGADPRMDGDNRQIIEKLISATGKIIDYPYPKMGIIIGRSYGGASVMTFPKFFGGAAVYALEGAHMGIMHESIITQLLSGSARLTKQWQQTSATQTDDLQDFIAGGHVDGVIKRSEIRHKIQQHLLVHQNSATLQLT
jgi:acetyl-CoA carboxylase carboxyltransferase component